MTFSRCPHEPELRGTIARGEWPASASVAPELHAHVAACRSCSDLALVAEAFRDARVQTMAAAHPGPAGVLWWRAQLRRRNAAVERIARPLLRAQIFAFAVALLAGAGFALFEARNGVDSLTWPYWRDWFSQIPQSTASHWGNFLSVLLPDPALSWMVLVPAAASLLLLGGAAIYLASEKH